MCSNGFPAVSNSGFILSNVTAHLSANDVQVDSEHGRKDVLRYDEQNDDWTLTDSIRKSGVRDPSIGITGLGLES